jgi:hypothetical protein
MPVLVVSRDKFPNASVASLYRDTSGKRVTLRDDGTLHVEYDTIEELLGDPVAKRILEMQVPVKLPAELCRKV